MKKKREKVCVEFTGTFLSQHRSDSCPFVNALEVSSIHGKNRELLLFYRPMRLDKSWTINNIVTITDYLYVTEYNFIFIFLISWKNPHSALFHTHRLISKERIHHYKQSVLPHLLVLINISSWPRHGSLWSKNVKLNCLPLLLCTYPNSEGRASTLSPAHTPARTRAQPRIMQSC